MVRSNMVQRWDLGWRLGLLLAALGACGCNMLTGAGDIVLVEDTDNGSSVGAGGEVGGSHQGGGNTSSGAGGNSSSGVGGGGTSAAMVNADGVTVTDVDLYQGIRRPLMQAGQPASSDIPIVAGKRGMLRVFYGTDGGYDGQPVTARLTIGDAPPIEVTASLAGSSSQGSLGSTVNIDVPGELLVPAASFKIELLQPAAGGSGGNAAAAYPQGGAMDPLAVEQGGVKLKILLVPVQNGGSLPDTSPQQVERYVRYFGEQYPVPEVEVGVRSQPYAFNGNLGSYNGWSQLLDEITDLRGVDGAPSEVYYYGIHAANSGGLLGLGWVGGSNDVWSRTAIGVGWSGDTAPGTAVHELGHNHGREHAPCGVSGDANYPHPGASLGVWGFSPSQQKLLDPNQYVDFMSYCDPAWISDYTFKAIFQRAKVVSTQPDVAVPPELMDRTYDRIKVLDGVATWKDVISLSRPPLGQAVSLEVVSPIAGAHTLTGHYYAYDHIEGGVLYVMRPQLWELGALPSQISFVAEGHAFTLQR